MPLLDLDDDVYQHLLEKAVRIGEDGSSILRRELNLPDPSKNGSGGISPKPKQANQELRSLVEFLSSPRLIAQRNATMKYLQVLGFLAQQHGAEFEKILSVRGRRRIYFARTREEVARSGRSLHPQEIPGTGFWAMTNADTGQKRDIVSEVLRVLGYPDDIARKARTAIR